MKKAIILLSGGIDSATTLAIARSEGYEVSALSFDYGQRHRLELEYAHRIAATQKIAHHLVITVNLRDIGGSALTSDMDVPKDRPLNLLSHGDGSGSPQDQEIPVTYVPARNTIFLSFALAWAERLGSSDIFIGVNALDFSGYPDCRPEYIASFETMANLATKATVEGASRVTIHAPLIDLTKADIITKASALQVDLATTWSCYDPQNGTSPCQRCDSCILRAKGFREAGIKDPLTLK